jgi:hypothetical protein
MRSAAADHRDRNLPLEADVARAYFDSAQGTKDPQRKKRGRGEVCGGMPST